MVDVNTTVQPKLLRHAEFRLLFAATAVSKLGVQVGYLAIPLVAVSALDASPGQVGLLAALSTVAFLLIGLPAGAWIDRMRRRGVMVAADVVRAALLGSVPMAWAVDALTLTQLYVVVFLAGFATVFFDVAGLSYVPHVVGRKRLVEANSALHSFDAIANIAGRSGAGYLIQWVTAPVALLVTAGGYLISGLCLSGIRRREPEAPRPGERRLWPQIREGLGFVLRHRILRPAALAGAATNLGMQLSLTMLPVVMIAGLALPESRLGLFLAAGGVGALVGALTAKRLGGVLGMGRMLWVLGLVVAPAAFLVPMLDRGAGFWLAMAGWGIVAFKIGVDNVVLVSFRQRVTPDGLLGRQNATMRFLLTGALAVGAALAGVVGELVSARAALWTGTVILALAWIPLFFSPIRNLRTLPAASDVTAVEAGPERG
ncbi:MFS transporter [Phytoactinopolyspora mesophila]|uniref:MFS transporter n=1 Tax=Phytoactinopolyspora mesophila TaxID=2650750 RepID=A0A7K3M5K5_9ACTN|nr:MFS transporter [Phytoactinopolyspora mesophila]NDL58525.1 MFS transporter [Phytoactinopolyspora mesophila]